MLLNLIGLYLKYHLYLAICYVVVSFAGLNFGIHKFALDSLEKLFKYIQQNESKFFTKKRKVTNEITEGNDGQSSEEIKINGYTKKEIDECFTEKDADLWNLLKPTWEPKGSAYEYKLNELGLLLFYCGLIFRITVLLPNRLFIFLAVIFYSYGGCFLTDLLSTWFPNSPRVLVLQKSLLFRGFHLMGMSFHTYCTHHRNENSTQERGGGGIAITNHTGPADIPILQSYRDYGFVFAPKKGFLIDPTYRVIDATGNYVRSEATDDPEVIKQRIIERAKKQDLDPLMIFAEGTCTAADTITRFKKGPFELDCTIYPIAIKYNQLYCSPFWDSRTKSFLTYCLQTLTNWSNVADVYHLPPVTRQESESAIQFAERVQGLIANQAGLKQVNIDGIKAKHGKL